MVAPRVLEAPDREDIMKNFAVSWRAGIFAAAGISILSATGAFAQEVTVWYWDPNFNGAAMQAAADRYAEINPGVTITLVDFAKADVEQKLQTQLASGTTEGLPDIVLIEDYGAQKYLLSFPGAFEPMTAHVDYSQFAPYKVDLATVDGETYSLPFDSGVTGLFYRTDILEQAGFTAADLEDITWSRFIEIAVEVHAKTGYPMIGLDINDASPIRIMLQSAGSWYFTPEGEANIADNPVFRAALETYQQMWMNPDIWMPISGWNEFTGSFTGDKVASVYTGVWITGTIKAADMAGQWGVAPLPRLDNVEGAVNASNLGGSSWYVLASSEEKDAAIDFLAQVWGQDADFYQDILIGQGAFATYLPARDGAAYSATDEYFGGQAVWQSFSDWVQEIPGVNYGIFTGEADAAVVAQIPALRDGGDIDEIIAAIDAQVRQQIQ